MTAAHQASVASQVEIRAPESLRARALAIPHNKKDSKRRFGFGLPRTALAGISVIAVVVISLTVLFFARSQQSSPFTDGEVLREETGALASPTLLSPGPGEGVDSEQLEFRWSESPGVEGYQFTLLDEKGDILYHTSTDKTRLEVPPSAVRLERGRTYFWYVTAKSPARVSADSEMGKFELKVR
jgi:hypothetical protein